MNDDSSEKKVNWEQACEDAAHRDQDLLKWFNRRAIMGEIVMLGFIVAGFVLIYMRDMWNVPFFQIFTVISCVYLTNRYVFYPLCYYFYKRSANGKFRTATSFIPEYIYIDSFIGCVEMLSSARTRMTTTIEDGLVSYRFYSLFYLPLIPIACYLDPTPMEDSNGDKYICALKFRWSVWEVIYIYLRNWSTFFIVALVGMGVFV
jgi:hypothetical protein